MPETRYMRSDIWTGSDYKLLTSNTAAFKGWAGFVSGFKVGVEYGIRVYGVNGATETELTSAVVAIVTYDSDGSGDGYKNNTAWVSSGGNVFEKFRVKVFWRWVGGTWALLVLFTTEALNGSLGLSLWRVYYYGACYYDPGVNRTLRDFRHGQDYCACRVENFAWTLGVQAGFCFGDGLVTIQT